MSLLSLLNENKVEKTFDDIKNFGNTLNGSNNIVRYEDAYDMPIQAQDNNSGWQTLESPERLSKQYDFDSQKEVMYFFNELYKYQFEINHHCSIKVENLNVEVETFTHGFEGVTESDLKIKEMADSLYTDIDYFKRNK